MLRPCSIQPRAFTLIELMVTVALMALLAGVAAMTFAQPIRRANARWAIDVIKRADAMAREEARRFGKPTSVVFDLRDQSIRRGAESSALPSGAMIRAIRSGPRTIDAGQFELAVSSLGLSRSYAVHLTGPELDQWLVFVGLSGEVVRANDEDDVSQLLSASRDDAR